MKQAAKEKREALRREFYRKIDESPVSLAEAVKGFRKMLGKNQREFAKFVNVPARTVMAVEQGKGNPTLKTIQKLLNGTGLEMKVVKKNRPQPATWRTLPGG